MDVETYVRESLKLFSIDPPDTSYQHGYLDAILVLAREAVGLSDDDPDVAAAVSANKLGGPLPRQALKLHLVKS